MLSRLFSTPSTAHRSSLQPNLLALNSYRKSLSKSLLALTSGIADCKPLSTRSFLKLSPPYISFTMYRWDINVRMSTIIGFAGGGGIGFLLQQNINLLNYRAASAQILAIAIVVLIMDYVSSALRQRVV